MKFKTTKMRKDINTSIERSIASKIHSIVNNAKSNKEVVNNVVELIILLAHIDNENAEVDYVENRVDLITTRFDIADKNDMANKIIEFVLDYLQ